MSLDLSNRSREILLLVIDGQNEIQPGVGAWRATSRR
jgi:hypothetical protein